MMEFSESLGDSRADIVELFRATFTASEGEEEGSLIGRLARNIFSTTEDGDIFAFTARLNSLLAGCIIFTRLRYRDDDRVVFLLAPVAVAPDFQRQGIGQALLAHGLSAMRQRGVDVAITYGNPNYYAKVGFRKITEQQAQPPLKLQYPEGWLGQPLSSRDFTPLAGASTCVDAFDDPAYW